MDQTKAGIEEAAEITEVKEKAYKKVLKEIGVVKTEKLKSLIVARCQSAKFIPWVVRATTVVLLWVCALQLRTLGETMGPKVLKGRSSYSFSLQTRSSNSFPPARIYKNNGFLMVSANGGLNQMRTGICDMVAIARYLNVTLIVPELDNTSFWNDHSEFKDIFDVNYFIWSLRDEVRILKELPLKQKKRVDIQTLYSFPPVSWSNMSFYFNTILPRIQKYEVLHFTKTDTRLANNGLPLELQKLRCRVNYNSLRFTHPINDLGKKIVRILRRKGPFLVLHLRYEMDMLAFSGCTEGCTENEAQELTKLRYAYTWWKEKEIDSDKKRAAGSCPLTPEETALALQALDIDRNIQIYIAAGDIYGGRRRLASLAAAYPNLFKKETLLKPSELEAYQNHSNQMAALDYLVALESDIFVPTYGGNMARVVEGHRRYLGFRTTINLDRKHLVGLIGKFRNGTLTWNEFSTSVKAAHANRMGKPTTRVEIQGKPKEEDYFYTNPQECLPPVTRSRHAEVIQSPM